MKKHYFTVPLSLLLAASTIFSSYAADGWTKEGDSWYYYRNDSKLANEWITEDDKTYYLGPDGQMATTTQLIDGYYYCFLNNGALISGPKGVVREYWRDLEINYDDNGRGTASTIKPDDALYSSTCVKWMNQTFAIYEDYVDDVYFFSGVTGIKRPPAAELLARDWGITSKETGAAVIHDLFETGKASDDKSVKAWNFSRAMMLCQYVGETGWINRAEWKDMQFAIAPTIQQSFSSWEDFNNHYMIGYRKWSASAGISQKTRDDRESAYKRVTKLITTSDQDYWIPWDRELIKYW